MAQTKNLKQLYMPDWEAVVRDFPKACFEAIAGLHCLEVIHVPSVKESEAFATNIPCTSC